jgi:hypothetical protein
MSELLERSNKVVIVFFIQRSVEKCGTGCKYSRPAILNDAGAGLDCGQLRVRI